MNDSPRRVARSLRRAKFRPMTETPTTKNDPVLVPKEVSLNTRLARRYDGMMTAGEGGYLVRVFAPKWWQLWRWASWFGQKRTSVVIVSDGRWFRARAVWVGKRDTHKPHMDDRH